MKDKTKIQIQIADLQLREIRRTLAEIKGFPTTEVGDLRIAAYVEVLAELVRDVGEVAEALDTLREMTLTAEQDAYDRAESHLDRQDWEATQ